MKIKINKSKLKILIKSELYDASYMQGVYGIRIHTERAIRNILSLFKNFEIDVSDED